MPTNVKLFFASRLLRYWQKVINTSKCVPHNSPYNTPHRWSLRGASLGNAYQLNPGPGHVLSIIVVGSTVVIQESTYSKYQYFLAAQILQDLMRTFILLWQLCALTTASYCVNTAFLLVFHWFLLSVPTLQILRPTTMPAVQIDYTVLGCLKAYSNPSYLWKVENKGWQNPRDQGMHACTFRPITKLR